ncbi:MAG: hypothetical protein HMLIMOIP_001987 [Candidatus Nitrosomirales archaeon]|jgi:hypothetical protein
MLDSCFILVVLVESMRHSRTSTPHLTGSVKHKDGWEISKLLELGVDPKFVSSLDPTQVKDMVKGLMYLSEKYMSQS